MRQQFSVLVEQQPIRLPEREPCDGRLLRQWESGHGREAISLASEGQNAFRRDDSYAGP
jgi:hypothetical protein